MDDLLPSYESAIDRDPWPLIARYLPSKDLCSAALICRKWHAIFTPHLWGNPASHFGVENDVVYVALTRFKRSLQFVRASVRELTHTLHFPPAHAEIYDGPHAEWLRDCLEYLPRLQCLVVNGLPFFDHSSLLNLRHPSRRWKSTQPNRHLMFSLRLLDAAGCKNATSIGLAEFLFHFPDLVSLDLSSTSAARDNVVLDSLKFLRNLRVLSLRGLGLKDADFTIIAPAIGTRVRSLDVSNNYLTDSSACLLLQYCLKETVVAAHITPCPLPPVPFTQECGNLDFFEAGNLVDHLRRKLTQGSVGSLAIEDARNVGLTHLYLTNNAMTVEGVSGLLRSERLQVLDIGTLTAVLKGPQDASSSTPSNLKFPGVSKLGPILSKYASAKLRYLRVNYEIVTEDAPPNSLVPAPRAELSSDPSRCGPLETLELEALRTPIAELDSSAIALVEAVGDAAQLMELSASSPSDDTSARHRPFLVSSDLSTVRCGATSAPEQTIAGKAPDLIQPILSDDSNAPCPHSGVSDNRLSPLSPPLRNPLQGSRSSPAASSRSRHNSSYFIDDRRARLELRQSTENRFHPGKLPKLHTLVLTDVPSHASKNVVDRLIRYIKDVAEESAIAQQRAKHSYMLPPGRSRAIAEQEYARSLFALNRIVLEMAVPGAPPKKISTSWRAYPTKSSTGDADSEKFWQAAAQDFSFFDEEECGLPTFEPGRTLPLAAMSGLELASPVTPCPNPLITPKEEFPLNLDVIDELGRFRKDRRAARDNLILMGELDPEVPGYWSGDLTVVRQPANADIGELDCYGNRFEAGWYYR
ncbi:hypothetical protein ACN47E_006285 [Coniothyrium glycines]